ncbi:hypothetical protein JHFBIEKO_5648 [Methylobacterium mesophilicum]|nr:hypothetical protein JHFBIEKO_5648 [Methylobacterium mesophilicum]
MKTSTFTHDQRPFSLTRTMSFNVRHYPNLYGNDRSSRFPVSLFVTKYSGISERA